MSESIKLPGVTIVGKIQLPKPTNKWDKVVVETEPQAEIIKLINTFQRPSCWGEVQDVVIIPISEINKHIHGTYVTFKAWMNMWMEDCGMQ